MSESELREFAELLHEEARAHTDTSTGWSSNGAFVEVYHRYLIEDGSLEDIDPCFYRKPTGRTQMEVSGYGFSDDGTVLDIVTADDGWKADVMRKDDLQRRLRWAEIFVEKCQDGLYLKLEESSPPYTMARRIHEAWPDLVRVRIFLFTDARITVESMPPGAVAGLRSTYELWDVARLHRLASSGRRSEETYVDLAELGGPLPCLRVPGDQDYECLLTVLPGQLVVDLYEQHGARLLQRNVRAYLQGRGKVNKGISTTVRETPGRFLAYNNGVSATATGVTTDTADDGQLVITSLTDLQIVNGGQTTASLHHTWQRDKADLAAIRVPAKITVVRSDVLDELVPHISRYANSQNAIKEADFEANSPYHVELQHLSRSIWAPAPEGSTRQTRWYYERVRGQYQVDFNRARTAASKAAFKKAHPMAQRFGKTDVAKYEFAYSGKPDVVSLGGEKCFARWTEEVVSAFEGLPDPVYFRDLVAKAILYEHIRKIIQKQRLGGHLGPTTAYTVALLADRCAGRIDLQRIWRDQMLLAWIADTVPGLARNVVRPLLIDAPGAGNVGEWVKKPLCWERIRTVVWQPPTP